MKRERKVFFCSKAFSRKEKVQVWNTQSVFVPNDVVVIISRARLSRLIKLREQRRNSIDHTTSSVVTGIQNIGANASDSVIIAQSVKLDKLQNISKKIHYYQQKK
jgi:hypothetical protein